MSLTRSQLHTVFGVVKSHGWIDPEALTSLLYDECQTEAERDLVISLIQRVRYLSSAEFSRLVGELCQLITKSKALSNGDSQIVAMAADHGADSSQFMLQMLKSKFPVFGWPTAKLVNRYDRAYKVYMEKEQYKNIVLIDEFVGSGHTVVNRVQTIKRVFGDAGKTDFNVIVRVVVATSMGLEYARSFGIDIECIVEITKGISDHFPRHDVAPKIALMKRLESILSTSFEGRDMPSLGHGEAEALYAREEGNVPNSVFPIFWWPVYSNENQRTTLLTRAMADA